MWTRIVAWYASKTASTWLLILCITVASAGAIYVQQLRVTVAKCRANQEQAQRFESLADRLAKELEGDRDAAIEKIENAFDDCLDRSVDDLLRDP